MSLRELLSSKLQGRSPDTDSISHVVAGVVAQQWSRQGRDNGRGRGAGRGISRSAAGTPPRRAQQSGARGTLPQGGGDAEPAAFFSKSVSKVLRPHLTPPGPEHGPGGGDGSSTPPRQEDLSLGQQEGRSVPSARPLIGWRPWRPLGDVVSRARGGTAGPGMPRAFPRCPAGAALHFPPCPALAGRAGSGWGRLVPI